MDARTEIAVVLVRSTNAEALRFEDSEAIGDVPYDNLGYIEPNEG